MLGLLKDIYVKQFYNSLVSSQHSGKSTDVVDIVGVTKDAAAAKNTIKFGDTMLS